MKKINCFNIIEIKKRRITMNQMNLFDIMPEDSGLQQTKQLQVVKAQFVITSYSIHYTKLYEKYSKDCFLLRPCCILSSNQNLLFISNSIIFPYFYIYPFKFIFSDTCSIASIMIIKQFIYEHMQIIIVSTISK